MKMPILFMSSFLAQDFHDIAPPIDYSLIPPWLIFLGAFVALTIIGLIAWLISKSFRRPAPIQSPRERALELLERMQRDVGRRQPNRFRIAFSIFFRALVPE